ncbi:hypothetical protein [Bradyrhizobium sp. SZCCHNS1012]|uniref:hypothetical protein n=1 Tax=Bradyrhizobium sp. SZCCHNS1012 TaxID=3057297 RepID=UPI00291612AA|nr:hypothetical protein [Bradyrhizobium sp. SZCCHNS1012]
MPEALAMPASKRKVVAVGWTEMLAAVKSETARFDARLISLRQELSDPSLTDRERDTVQRVIEQQERHAEVFAAAWRVLWSVRSDERLLKRLHEVRRAEQVSDDNQPDHVQYE